MEFQSHGSAVEKLASTMASSNGKYRRAYDPNVGKPPKIPYLDNITARIKEVFDRGPRRNFIPQLVAIGPHFRGRPDLEDGEEIKLAAAHDFCVNSGRSVHELYARVQAVASEAQACYAAPTSPTTIEDFTNMLFVDGCFVLQFVALATRDGFGTSADITRSDIHGSIGFDMLIVENQLPWFVLDALMALRPVQIIRFIDFIIVLFDKSRAKPDPDGSGQKPADYKPRHLLDLLCKRQLGPTAQIALDDPMYTQEISIITSALDLAEAGVEVCASRTARFGDVSFGRRCLVFGRLALPPLMLSHRTIGLLLNMVALEKSVGPMESYNVCGYVCLLTVLVNGEKDVAELRRKGILNSMLSDREVLEFLKAVQPHLSAVGPRHYLLLASINSYYKRSRVWITIHRFVYNNLKFLVAIGSFFSISASILKAIFSLQQSPAAGH